MTKESDPTPRWQKLVWPLILAAAIFGASGTSDVPGPVIPYLDKVVHFSLFGLLGTVVLRATLAMPRGWIWAVVIVSLFGLSDEWHQSFTPGRSVEFADWVADTLGAIVAVALYQLWPAYRAFLEHPLGRRYHPRD